MSDSSEFGRKAFHMLSLVYLAAYHGLGYPRVVAWMLGWSAIVVGVETARLYLPALNRRLTAFFGGMARAAELNRFSGIFHTTVGVLLVVLAYGDRSRLVTASVLYLAFGDAAAALFGKSFGRHKILAGRKSLEGSLACFAACVLVGWAMGFAWPAALSGALAATLLELPPPGAYFNDNLLMPLGSAAALSRFVS